MKVNYVAAVLLAALSLSACKKDKITPVLPSVNFGIYHIVDIYNRAAVDSADVIKISTYEKLALSSLAKNSSSLKWDLGDGTVTSKDSPELYFTKSGTYTVSLTATSSTGATLTKSKKILVLDRVLKLVRITNLYFNGNFVTSPNWPLNQVANVQAVIKKIGINDYPIFSNGDYQGENVYQSAPVQTTANMSTPIEIPVKEKVILDMEALQKGKYGFHIYASANEERYLLTSNWGSGVGISYTGNMISNYFNISSGFNGNGIELIFAFE
ncbi:PKD domain-containing protein [Pedobacter sp. GSP4]|uniref:PKD domain-containing protein n=1 Tax=Pedobacter sp. GSP4 TaxID=3453716 RepID=UPI003EEF4DC0